jgi:Protein of unknown function (DUF3300)
MGIASTSVKERSMLPIQTSLARLVAVVLAIVIVVPPQTLALVNDPQPVFQQEELDAILAPIALYPDALLSQIFMASTYPLEVVQADRWVKQNSKLEGKALSDALEQQSWDPSVKSLVNFPRVLSMMSEKLDWMTKLGDAFMAQQKDVMDTVQTLRAKAHAAGHLKTTAEQEVIVEKQIIRIESPSPQVVYVPVYNPSVVYGAWWYPAYPPYVYYPPGYVAGTFFSFGIGGVVGAAWGYAWGRCDWHRHHVHININRNLSVNRHINRRQYQTAWHRRGYVSRHGRGAWRHDTAHRRGVAYRDRATAQRFNGVSRMEIRQTEEPSRSRTTVDQSNLSRDRSIIYSNRPTSRSQTLERRNPAGTVRRDDMPQHRRSYTHQETRGMRSRDSSRSRDMTRSRRSYTPSTERGSRTRSYSSPSRTRSSIMGGGSRSRSHSVTRGSIRRR